MTWKVRVTPRSAILWGGSPVIFRCLKKTSPESGLTNPVIRLTRVVFPDPFGPITPRISPLAQIKTHLPDGCDSAKGLGDLFDLKKCLFTHP